MKKMIRKLLAATLLAGFLAGSTGPVRVQASSRYTIYVNRRTNIVNVVDNRKHKLARSMYCSTGEHYSTVKGTFHTTNKYRWRALFGHTFGQYAIRFHGHYLFHSVPYGRTSRSRVKVSNYNKLGRQDSMGCVRMAVCDEKWLYDHTPIGTKVVIGDSRKMTKPTRKKLKITNGKKYSWDPTDPAPGNPYRPKLGRTAMGKKTVEYGSKFDIKKMVSARSEYTDKPELLDHMKAKGKVNTKKPGTYKVKVTVTDPNTTLQTTKTFSFVVGEAPEE